MWDNLWIFFVYTSLTQFGTGFVKLQNHRVVTSVLEQFWCPNLVKIYSILSKVEDLLHNVYLVLVFRPNDLISYSVMEFCRYLTWWRIDVSEILNDVLYLQNKNYFYISVGWFCWYMLPKNIIVIIGNQMLNILKNLICENLQVFINKKVIKQNPLAII